MVGDTGHTYLLVEKRCLLSLLRRHISTPIGYRSHLVAHRVGTPPCNDCSRIWLYSVRRRRSIWLRSCSERGRSGETCFSRLPSQESSVSATRRPRPDPT